MHSSLRLSLLLLPLFAMACGDGVSNAVEACDAASEEEVCEVFRLVNEARADAGVAALVWDASLARAAQGHAKVIVANHDSAHVSQYGSSFVARIHPEDFEGHPTGVNIAKGQQTPAAVMENWMHNDDHRANILSTRSNAIGIGLDGRTWVQIFGRK